MYSSLVLVVCTDGTGPEARSLATAHRAGYSRGVVQYTRRSTNLDLERGQPRLIRSSVQPPDQRACQWSSVVLIQLITRWDHRVGRDGGMAATAKDTIPDVLKSRQQRAASPCMRAQATSSSSFLEMLCPMCEPTPPHWEIGFRTPTDSQPACEQANF